MPTYSNNESINKYYDSLKTPVNAQMQQAERDYAASQAELKRTKEGQDAQAYRALQRQLRTTPEAMSAAGAQGGMVDSGIAFIKNRYLQGRNDRDLQYASDRSALERNYTNNMDALRAQVTQYEQQAAADRAELEYLKSLEAAKGGNSSGSVGGVSTKGGSYNTTTQVARENEPYLGNTFNKPRQVSGGGDGSPGKVSPTVPKKNSSQRPGDSNLITIDDYLNP